MRHRGGLVEVSSSKFRDIELNDDTASVRGTTISSGDLLMYMGPIVSELEKMALSAECTGLADLFGCASREIDRNLKIR